MSHKYLRFITVMLLLCAKSITAQQLFDLNGKITDLDDGKELEGTFVILQEKNQTQITNEHGRFHFSNLETGNYHLVIRHVGCRDSSISITLKKNVFISIKLPHSAIELSEIDIMDKQPDMLKTQTVNEIKDKDLDKTRGQTLGDALKLVSGVTTLNTGSTISKPMIHGMQGYRILILNNGIRQEGQQWGNEHAPEIDPFMAQKLSVIKGANAVRYGSDAMAGVILVEPNDLPDTAALRAEINLVGASNGKAGTASGILEGYFDKLKYLSWRLQGTVKNSGNIKTPDYYLKNTGTQEINYSAAMGYHRKTWGIEGYYSQFNSKIGIFSGAHVGNLTDLKAAFNSSKPQDSLAGFSYDIGRPYQDIAHELAKGNLHVHIAPRWIATLQYAYQYNIRKEYDKHPPLNNALAALNKPELDYRITSQTTDLVIEHLNIKSFRGQFGGSYMNQKNVYLGRFFIPNFKNNTWGIFASERYVRPHLEVEAGMRYDYKNLKSYYYVGNVLQKPDLSFSNISWNAGAIIKPKHYFHVFINLGSAWRAPAPNELYSNGIHHGVGSIERGDPDLKTEQVYNGTVTGLLQLKHLQAEISMYHNQFENYIYLNPADQPELTIRGAYPVFNYKQANVRISGMDVKISGQLLNHIELSSKMMILRAWNYTINDYLVYMPSDRYSLNLRYYTDITKHIKDFYAEAGYQYVTKQWRVPQNTDFAAPPAAYSLLSAEVGVSLLAGRQRLDLSIAATNLTDEAYRDYLDRFRYFCDSQGRNLIVRIKAPLTLYDKP